jgi:tRNA(Arg) A34 adenosine deaminase TadA
MTVPHLTLNLPAWVDICLAEFPGPITAPEERMRLVLELARQNIAYGGGPFAAAVFTHPEGVLLAPGVNMVVAGGSSVLHAVIVALMLAQKAAGCYDLGAGGQPVRELVASCEPCAMCVGALSRSGVRRLVCGARGEDTQATGFDMGDKPGDWVAKLERRGITVVPDQLRPAAIALLRGYRAAGRAMDTDQGG